MFQRPLSPTSALLQQLGSSTGLQMSFFTGFMYFEIKFFISKYMKLESLDNQSSATVFPAACQQCGSLIGTRDSRCHLLPKALEY